MRKQFRAADLYQSFTGVEPLPQIRGITEYKLVKNDHDGGYDVQVTFTDGVTLVKNVNWTSCVRVFDKHANSYLADTRRD